MRIHHHPPLKMIRKIYRGVEVVPTEKHLDTTKKNPHLHQKVILAHWRKSNTWIGVCRRSEALEGSRFSLIWRSLSVSTLLATGSTWLGTFIKSLCTNAHTKIPISIQRRTYASQRISARRTLELLIGRLTGTHQTPWSTGSRDWISCANQKLKLLT